jgi:hypothetical protein
VEGEESEESKEMREMQKSHQLRKCENREAIKRREILAFIPSLLPPSLAAPRKSLFLDAKSSAMQLQIKVIFITNVFFFFVYLLGAFVFCFLFFAFCFLFFAFCFLLFAFCFCFCFCVVHSIPNEFRNMALLPKGYFFSSFIPFCNASNFSVLLRFCPFKSSISFGIALFPYATEFSFGSIWPENGAVVAGCLC